MSAIIDACRRIKADVSLSNIIRDSGVKLFRSGTRWAGRCPFHGDRSPSFWVYPDNHWHCFGGCGSGDAVDFICRTHSVGVIDAIRMIDGGALPTVSPRGERSPNRQEPDRSAEAAAIWRNAVPPAGTAAERYLRRRGITIPLPPSIRFARLPFGYRDPMPALVALVVGADGAPRGIQRTYLDETGRKAVLPNGKVKFSLGPISGGAIRLAPPASEVIVTEGLEDALTLQQELGGAVWAVAGAGMLPKLALPAEVASVVIGADNDPIGGAAAEKAAEAYRKAGRMARIILPADEFKDFNAELMGALS